MGLLARRWLKAAASAWVLLCVASGVQASVAVSTAVAAQSAEAADAADAGGASADQQRLVNWIAETGDNHGHPFVLVDKQAASLRVYRADGSLAGATTVLLGRTRGDLTQPGVGERTQTGHLLPEDLTTPAGRFESEPGRNRVGEDVVWVDHAAALAIHRLRPGASQAERLRRLASVTPEDNRASAGCVVVPVSFYLDVVQPLLGQQAGVVYILPERGMGEGTQWADGLSPTHLRPVALK
ncbi:L,D-transpeptidase [Ideonella azotifigens]|uniref:L,D-transpeptidase n=1 Tax=Ideonella azotifigens TaxID=513160 RepID=UPI001E596F73|nr:L,D-transpeptidase [Ideonella azotifigens]MCD2343241.1 L,D-transpeptidase [Ideonella azotifigens]